jgi:polysaccharide export outer membrane protein
MLRNARLMFLLLAVSFVIAGCGTPQSPEQEAAAQLHARTIYLREGDTLKISFPSSPNLDTTQQIRRDGKITLPLVGDVDAAGMTHDELQQKLADLYFPQISSREVLVSLQASTFPVFVTGCVIHPGKISSDHPMSALDAVMEAGGFDYEKADLRNVKVTRQGKDKTQSYTLNLKAALDGKDSKPFYLEPEDIVFVPERFSWF